MQDSGSLAVFKVKARDQGHYKGPSGAFVTYCNISCFFNFLCCITWKELTTALEVCSCLNYLGRTDTIFRDFHVKGLILISQIFLNVVSYLALEGSAIKLS